MGYTNSPLVAYTKLSPNHSGQRTHSIDRISPHCVVGQCTAEGLGDWFAKSSTQASSNYGIDKNGRVGLYVEEKNRSWCTSSNANDQRAITIECASDTAEPYWMNDTVYDTLIKLCTDICKRNGKTKLLWFSDKEKALNYQPKSDEMVITVHRWFANKSCPGNWLFARLGDVAEKVTAALGGVETPAPVTGLQAISLKDLSEADVIKKIGALFTADQKKSGILASVSMAQFILESGYGKSELAANANNCFGMKKSLSGNTWAGSAWDGSSVYAKKTQEYEGGKYVTVTADFRKYLCVENSIADHSAYLIGAMNGSKKRYEGLAGCIDYKKAAQIIKDGGYATAPTYVTSLCNIIEKWNLTQYNVPAPAPVETVTSFPATPFTVQVIIDDLNYRSVGSMSGTVKGQTGKGVFTIVEVNKDGWGKLKSGVGWIYLGNPSYCTVQNTQKTQKINYGQKVYDGAVKTYGTVCTVKCKHKSGAKTLAEIKSKKVTTCNTSSFVSGKEGGIFKGTAVTGHTAATGKNGSALLKVKKTLSQCVKNSNALDTTRAKWVFAGCTYDKLPAELKEPGNIYYYDSNSAVSAGGGKIFSTNNSGDQLNSEKCYYDMSKVTRTSGYCFTHTILWVAHPLTV